MAIETIIESLADVYRESFTCHEKNEGLWIKRVTVTVPEAVVEWPWLYFIADAGEVRGLTLPSPHDATFGDETVRRRNLQVKHQFKAQLLVRPRRDLGADEAAARKFLQPVLTVTDENFRLGGVALSVQVISYNYGLLTFGQTDQRATEYIGIEFVYQAIEVI